VVIWDDETTDDTSSDDEDDDDQDADEREAPSKDDATHMGDWTDAYSAFKGALGR
jgi:hypothetical protein